MVNQPFDKKVRAVSFQNVVPYSFTPFCGHIRTFLDHPQCDPVYKNTLTPSFLAINICLLIPVMAIPRPALTTFSTMKNTTLFHSKITFLNSRKCIFLCFMFRGIFSGFYLHHYHICQICIRAHVQFRQSPVLSIKMQIVVPH